MLDKEKQINALKNLGLTDEEIAEVLTADNKIDKGEKLFDLPKELEKGAKKARMSGNCNGYTKTAKSKEKDLHKLNIIQNFILALEEHSKPEQLEIKNPEREFEFVLYGKKYKVVLSCPRT